jgi:hypothetical protein
MMRLLRVDEVLDTISLPGEAVDIGVDASGLQLNPPKALPRRVDPNSCFRYESCTSAKHFGQEGALMEQIVSGSPQSPLQTPAVIG